MNGRQTGIPPRPSTDRRRRRGRAQRLRRWAWRRFAFATAFASCQNYPDGYYNAYAHMAEEDLDLVAFLGDYIYEGSGQGKLGRGHTPAQEIWSLADYRVRHAQYKSDPTCRRRTLPAGRAVVFDDHEVENNWADEVSQNDGEPDADPQVFLERRARAFQAYYEHMPLRRSDRLGRTCRRTGASASAI